MKQALIGLALSVLLAACTVTQPGPTEIPAGIPANTATTAPLAQLPTTTPIPLQQPTETSTRLSSVASTQGAAISTIPPTFTPTSTKIPATPTMINSLSSFNLPISNGKIFFTWTPGVKPAPEMLGSDDTLSRNLYMASPGDTEGEWTIEVILPKVSISKLLLSPDQTKLALFYLEDTNQDGHYDELGGDTYKLGVYDIVEKSLLPLAIDGYIYGLSWVDNQTLVLSQETNFAFIQTDGSLPIWLTSNPLQPEENDSYNLIRSITSSPDGKYQAVGSMSGIGTSEGMQLTDVAQLAVFDVAKAQLIPVINALGPGHSHYMAMVWSPDSQWLATVPGYKTDSLNIVNISTLETIPFEVENHADLVIGLPTWSYDKTWLAFTVNRQELWFWDASTFIQYEAANKHVTSSTPIWSPQKEIVVVSFAEGDKNGWLLIDPVNGTSHEFYIDGLPYGTPIWSPDGKWILFSTTKDEKNSYYVLDVNNGDTFLVIDSTGLWDFDNFIWITD